MWKLFLAILLIIAVALFFPELTDFTSTAASNINEGFSADRVPSGEYPREVDEPLLYPTYQKKKTDYGVIFRDNNSENNSKLYPVSASIGNNDQATNNVRDWVTPDNGSCAPASMCGALYEPKAPSEQKIADPLPFNVPEKRVGYYASARL
jgi:hypothetical protein